MRQHTCIDSDWRFLLGDDLTANGTNYATDDWRVLDLPHDWSIEATPHPDNPAKAGGGFFPGGVGWYRKELAIPADLGDQRALIEFDGVYMNSEVWCNGKFCGRRPYGYSSFCYDITHHVEAGEPAQIAVRIDNSRQRNSRWYSGSGIYRHVWLTIADPVRVGHWGTYITTPEVSADEAVVNCVTTVVNDGEGSPEVMVSATVIGPDGELTVANAECSVGQGTSADVTQEVTVPSPKLWSPEKPQLYTWRTEVKVDGNVVDSYDTTFGIRSVRFDASDGMFLNGESIKMKGVNEHHDAGCLGAAVPDDVIRRRLRILKDMGCNAIRVAHNPASPTFLDLCDEMGLLVVEDAFDEWRNGKTPYGYQLYWDQWWEKDLADMIHRDRNHPCVVLWSVGNEIVEVRSGDPVGLPIMEGLRDVCHREDPTRPMTCGCCDTRTTLAAGYGPLMDVVGYNGGSGSCFDYEKDHVKYPEMIIFASEVPHTLQTRGVYKSKTWQRNPGMECIWVENLTEEEIFPETAPQHLSSYDNAMVRISAIDSWRLTRDLPFMCGEFRWTGFDYLGECYGWPAKSWNFGIIDLCGFPKDTYFLCQSEWTDTPMVHVLPHWTWPGMEGVAIPVIVYTNCETVELFLDGESLGVKDRDRDAMLLRWDVPYKAGVIRAVGRIRGDEAVTCQHETAGAPAAIKVSAGEDSIRADGTGVGHCAVTIVDAEGRFVPNANAELTVDVSGAGRLIGLENGDPIDSTNYKTASRKAFNGMALAIVQAGTEAGDVKVAVSADGLAGAECVIPAQ